MKLLITYDESGEILSITKAMPLTNSGVGVLPAPGMSVTEVELSEEFADLPLNIIHKDFYIELRGARLVRREHLPEEGELPSGGRSN